jgi:hypothetical protein
MANPNAASAEDAFVRVKINKGIVISNREVSARGVNGIGLDVIEIGKLLKIADPCFFTHHAVVGMIREDQ